MFWSEDPLTLLKIVEEPKEILLIWIVSIYTYSISN